MDLETKILFLDTSVFVRENFTRSRKLDSLIDMHRYGIIELKIMDIVYEEILKKIKDGVDESSKIFRRFDREIDKNCKILKIIDGDDFSSYLPVKRISIDNTYNKIKEEFNNMISFNEIKIIESKSICPIDIFRKYIKTEPPFGKKDNKKCEFPDAIILTVIKNWCIENSNRAMVLSNDGDFQGFDEEHIIYINDLGGLLNNLNIKRENLISSRIYNSIEYHKNEIIELIGESIESEIASDIELNDPYKEDVDSSMSFKRGRIINSYIVNMDQESKIANIEFNLNIELEGELEYNDLESAIYNKKDDVHYNVHHEKRHFDDFLLEVSVNVDISYGDFDGDGYIQFELDNNFTLNSINIIS